ncbi:MAG: 4Fe-4S binding protein [Rubrivivax sp.]
MRTLAIATPAPRPVRRRLAAFGDALRRHRAAIAVLQWCVVLVYAVLVVVPAFLPLPESSASIVSNLRLAAQFAFWGLWWPFVIVSIMALGRVWCGLLCPEGALTEFASRHGLGRSIPRWMRWPGWPLAAFALTTIYGQLVSVYEYPDATLLVLGGSTLAAVAVGAVYGKGGKRVWCRHLCPVNGVFALLAKVAPLHYRTDVHRWQQYQGPNERVDCAPLLDLRHLQSASDCHACGRCSGHRGAIALELRAPNREIVQGSAKPAAAPDAYPARLLVFGLLGLAPGAFQWSASPWFIALKQGAAQWLIERGYDTFWFRDDLPWWLLTHQSDAGDVFSLLDGASILAFMAASTLVLGGATWLALRAAARLCSGLRWHALALALVPLAGAGLFLGLSMLTLTQLRAEGIAPPWIGVARMVLLGAAAAWSAWLGARLVAMHAAAPARRAAAWLAFMLPVALSVWNWVVFFFPALARAAGIGG